MENEYIDGLTDHEIKHLLAKASVIALVGASAKPERPSYRVMSALLQAGYKVMPINPGLAGGFILGQTVYADLASLPVKVDIVNVFRASTAALAIAEQALAIEAASVWYQVGIISPDALSYLQENNVPVVMNRCTKLEALRLL